MKNSNHANSAHSANLGENFAPQTACSTERQKAIKNTIYASLGGILEFYDFILYVFFAVAIFPQIFFPPNSDIWASVGGWVSFGVAYLARPFGAVVFGHFGDKFGRKKIFYISMLLMVLPSFVLAFLPTYESIGIAATLALFAIRIIQGLAVGADVSGGLGFCERICERKKQKFSARFHLG